jgi:hypothetical protein
LFSIAALTCGIFAFGLGIAEFRDPIFWIILAKHPFSTLNTMTLGFVTWLLVFCVYFGRRAFVAARQGLNNDSLIARH